MMFRVAVTSSVRQNTCPWSGDTKWDRPCSYPTCLLVPCHDTDGRQCLVADASVQQVASSLPPAWAVARKRTRQNSPTSRRTSWQRSHHAAACQPPQIAVIPSSKRKSSSMRSAWETCEWKSEAADHETANWWIPTDETSRCERRICPESNGNNGNGPTCHIRLAREARYSPEKCVELAIIHHYRLPQLRADQIRKDSTGTSDERVHVQLLASFRAGWLVGGCRDSSPISPVE